MKAYKIELLIVDHDECGETCIKDVLENTVFPNRCISPRVMEVTEAEIGEWSDAHPLNQLATTEAEYKKAFPATAAN